LTNINLVKEGWKGNVSHEFSGGRKI
jgi:hypothetical protein